MQKLPKEKYTEATTDLLKYLLGLLVDEFRSKLERSICADFLIALVARDNKMKAAFLESSHHDL